MPPYSEPVEALSRPDTRRCWPSEYDTRLVEYEYPPAGTITPGAIANRFGSNSNSCEYSAEN